MRLAAVGGAGEVDVWADAPAWRRGHWLNGRIGAVDLGDLIARLAARFDFADVDVSGVEGQIEGGIAQGIGMALMEEFTPGRGENLHDYLIPTIGDVPPIESILIECASSAGPFGAKGIGESATFGVSPAIANAIHDAIGKRIRKLPIKDQLQPA